MPLDIDGVQVLTLKDQFITKMATQAAHRVGPRRAGAHEKSTQTEASNADAESVSACRVASLAGALSSTHMAESVVRLLSPTRDVAATASLPAKPRAQAGTATRPRPVSGWGWLGGCTASSACEAARRNADGEYLDDEGVAPAMKIVE